MHAALLLRVTRFGVAVLSLVRSVLETATSSAPGIFAQQSALFRFD